MGEDFKKSHTAALNAESVKPVDEVVIEASMQHLIHAVHDMIRLKRNHDAALRGAVSARLSTLSAEIVPGSSHSSLINLITMIDLEAITPGDFFL